MPTWTCNNPSRQRGDILLEALIGLLLMAILALGLSYAMGRALNAQYFKNTQALAVNELRDQLHRQGAEGVCRSQTLAVGPRQATLESSCTDVALIAGGDGLPTASLPAAKQLISLSTKAGVDANTRLFGGDGQIEVSP